MKLAKRSRTSFRSNRRLISKLLGVRRLGIFEHLEVRFAMSADSIDGRPYIDLGPSDNVALDQPRVVMELIQLDGQSVGPGIFNTFLLDTGANTILTFQSAVNDMNDAPPPYRTDGTFEEIGVGGASLYDISIPYQIDYAGTSGVRNTIPVGRIISDDTRDLSIFGPWGITGMPAMTEKVTTLDFTNWTTISGTELFMEADFSDTLPAYDGPRYSIPVDKRISFNPEGSVVTGSPPVWAHLPFLTGQLKQDSLVATGNFLFDTGAQVSIMSSHMAFTLGLDSNLDGLLDNRDANYARDETISGIGGLETVPVFLVDQIHLPTNQGADLVWTDLQLLILDIIPGIDAILGFDLTTSGWIEAFAIDGQSGYIMQSQLDFRNWKATGLGTVYYDINPEIFSVVDPNGPGAVVTESGGVTSVSETGVTDTYQVSLNRAPTANVRVNLVPASGDQVRAVNAALPANTFLDFTPANWNVPQTVLVTGVNDATEEGLHRSFVRHISSSADPRYQNVGMPRVITNIIDNDFPGVMLIPTDGSTNVVEGGAGDTYQIVLTFPPTQPVTIDLENAQNQVRAVRTIGGGTSVVFSTTNWNVPQSVSVTAVDDTRNEGPHKTFITHRITSTDDNYAQTFALQETVFIGDNDQVDTIPPRIVDVIVGSSTWKPSFVDMVDGGGIGSGNGLGISLPGSSQLNNLSQNGINKIYVKFSENVGASITPAKLSLIGTNKANYMTGATVAYGADGANVLTITLPTRVSKDAVVFSILDTLTDAAGNRLDGEWVDGQSSTSGNGASNGQFNFRMDFLPGDVDNTNRVTAKDLQLAQGLLGKGMTSTNRVYDIDGNAVIDNADLLLIQRLMGSALPSAPAAPSSRGTGSPKGGLSPDKASNTNPFRPQPFTIGRPSGERLIDELLAKKQRLAEFGDSLKNVELGADPTDSKKDMMPTILPSPGNSHSGRGASELNPIDSSTDTLRTRHVDAFMQNLAAGLDLSIRACVDPGWDQANARSRAVSVGTRVAWNDSDLFQQDAIGASNAVDAMIDGLVTGQNKRRRSR